MELHRDQPGSCAAASIACSLSATAAAAPDVKLKRDTRAADLLFGSVSGFVGKLVEYPFDTVKVRLQAQPIDTHARAAFSGRTAQCIRDMVAQDGYRSFYRGISAPLIGSMVENSVLFIAYNQIQHSIRQLSGMHPSDTLSLPQLSLAGAISGAAVAFVLTPVELVKCRLQVQGMARHAPPQPPLMSAIASSHAAAAAAAAAAFNPALAPFSPRPQRPFAGATHSTRAAYSSIGARWMLAKHASPTVSGGFGLTGHLSDPPHTNRAFAATTTVATATSSAPPTKTPHFRSSLAVILHTLRTDGLAGLYRGHTGTLLREIAGGAAWFGSYELTVKALIDASPSAKSKEDLSPWWLMAAGAIAGVSYNAALFPADVIKSRQQSLTAAESGSFLAVGRELYRAEGVRGLYRGFGITIARSAPTSGVIFLTYEILSRNLTVEID